MTQTPTTKHQSLWADLNGHIACPEHMGYSASAVHRLQENPNLRRIETGLTVWTRLSKAEAKEWAEWLMEEYQVGEPCEGCRWTAKETA